METATIAINKDMEKMNTLRNLSLKENSSSVTNNITNPQNAKLRNGTLLNSEPKKLLFGITIYGIDVTYVVSMDILIQIV